MPFDTIVILGFVALLFASFAGGLLWADYQTRGFRD
jgi:hypothetical protein